MDYNPVYERIPKLQEVLQCVTIQFMAARLAILKRMGSAIIITPPTAGLMRIMTFQAMFTKKFPREDHELDNILFM